jgi:cytosine/adenosine deaminase-related metal-dependent hydrolase
MTVGDDGRITGIGAGQPPADDAGAAAGATREGGAVGVAGGAVGVAGGAVLDVAGAFVAPGFVSAHSHLFTSASRGLGLDQSLYGWIVAMTRHTGVARPDDLYWFTLHGALDFLNNGITTAYDFTSNRLDFAAVSEGLGGFGGVLKPPEVAEVQLTAKVDAGVRFINSVSLDQAVGTPSEALDRLEAVVSFAQRYRDHPGMLGMALSGAVQWAESESTAALEVEAMRRFGLINQPHFLETPFELDHQRARFAWYRAAGALGPDLVFGHFVHATPAMIAEAAAAGCGMVWQPCSNGRLASGVADIPACRAAGMRVGVGLDDQACTDISDPWQNMRMGIYVLRAVTHDPASMAPADMLELHTLGSATVLGIDGAVGSLEVGKYADFVVVDPRRPDTGPVWDAYGTYVLACGLRNLRRVYVGGQLVSLDATIVHTDSEAVSDEVHRRMATLAGQAPGPVPGDG